MSYAFVRLGNGNDPHGTPFDYPATDAGLRQALSDGKRWIVLEESFSLTGPLNLSVYHVPHLPINSLRLQGAGGRMIHLNGHRITQDPAGTDYWRLSITGLVLTGGITMKRLRDSFFEDCIFEYSAGVSVDTSSRVDIDLDSENIIFIACEFLNSPHQFGLRSYGKNVTIFGGTARYNGQKGLALLGDCGSITSVFVSHNGHYDGENVGILLGFNTPARCIAVRNCFMDDDHVRLAAASYRCIAENNLLGASAQVINTGLQNLVDLNVDA